MEDYSFLLSRPEWTFPDVREEFRGKRVLITGAGGTIGSTIAKKLQHFDLSSLWLVGHSEHPLFKLSQEIKTPIARFRVADIRNSEGLVQKIYPDIIIHAAAHKHVGLMENNTFEALENNTLATIRLCKAAQSIRAQFFFISTDKAVNPSSVMGASKRLAELWIQANAPQAQILRFGNVLGSSGSLVEIIEEKIKNRQPITLTSNSMRRYFITAKEAAGLVLTSAVVPPGMWSLRMGRSIRIVDVINRLMECRGFSARVDLGTPGRGEKLDEELLNPGEVSEPSEYEGILQIRFARPDADVVEHKINEVMRGVPITKVVNEP